MGHFAIPGKINSLLICAPLYNILHATGNISAISHRPTVTGTDWSVSATTLENVLPRLLIWMVQGHSRIAPVNVGVQCGFRNKSPF